MKIENLDFEIAKQRVLEYKNSLIYFISSTELYTSERNDINWEQCTEARFFSEDSELRFFRNDDGWIVSLISDDGLDKISDMKYELDNRFLSVGRYVTVREYLSADDDGQMIITAKRLVSVE